jgi:subtilisin family serine protease
MTATDPDTGYASDRIIIKYKSINAASSSLSTEFRADINAGIGAESIIGENQLGVPGMEVVSIPDGKTVQETIDYYSKNPEIEYAEPDYLLYALPAGEMKISVPVNPPAISDHEHPGQAQESTWSLPIAKGGISSRIIPDRILPASAGEENNAQGYRNYPFNVVNGSSEITTTIEPMNGISAIPGSIHITSVPPGARIWMDGLDMVRNTPNNLTTVNPGSHTITLNLSGYQNFTTTVTVAEGETSLVNASLISLPRGDVNITSTPPGSTIYLDGRVTGYATPNTLSQVPEGSHIIRLVKNRYQDWIQPVTVIADQTVYLHAKMAMNNPDNLPFPDDLYFSYLYGLHNDGQFYGGTPDADIDAPEAWIQTTGSSDVVVAVVDTGVDYNHPDLAANIWSDPSTGYHGYDYVNRDTDPMDDNSHGTHCAGTIGAVGNNGIGVAGVNWNVKIMAVKFLGASGSGSTSNAIQAILYANSHGAHVISNSWGGGGYSQALKDAIDASPAVVVCAAGNSARDTDAYPHYPSSYNSTNIISVAATDKNDNLASFSNYGETSVDVAAPGVSIYSTIPESKGSYGSKSGTSMATPHVAGLAALVKAAHPSYTTDQIKSAIIYGVDAQGGLNGKCASGGRVNAYQAVQGIVLPAPVISTITPSSAPNSGPITITGLTGTNFQNGAIVNLTRVGKSNITATSVTVPSPTAITCTLPITGASPGAWNVVVTNPDERSGILTGGFTITSLDPQAKFYGVPGTEVNPLTVQFYDVSAGTVFSRIWNFGDGETSTEQNPVHTFHEAKTYTITLTVTDEGGSTGVSSSEW